MRKCLWKCVAFCGTAFLFTLALTSYSAQGAGVLVGPNPMVHATSAEYVMHGPPIPPCDPDCGVAVKHGPPICEPDCVVAVKHGPPICEPDCVVAVKHGPPICEPDCVVAVKHGPPICEPDCVVAVKHGQVIPVWDPDCAVTVQYGPAALPWDNHVLEIKHVPEIRRASTA